MATSDTSGSNFIERVIAEDLASGRFDDRVVTRFPPEPNGYLHIGHAKSICLNFGLAAEHAGGRCHLRFDDTNPTKEDVEYVDSIMADVRWLGFDWGAHLYYASDYFEQLYDWAVQLIRAGTAYVDDQSAEEMRASRGTLTEPGRDEPVPGSVRRGEPRSLRAGCGRGSSRTARACCAPRSTWPRRTSTCAIPTMYRIRKVAHHRTGETWCIYPMYDFAHGQSDSIEGITHSICTLEFEDHRPLYDWFLDQLGIYHPQQIEFARLNISLHRDEQAPAPRAGRGRARERLGRSAHADHRRLPAARLHAGGHPRLLRADRRGQDGQRSWRRRCSSTACART